MVPSGWGGGRECVASMCDMRLASPLEGFLARRRTWRHGRGMENSLKVRCGWTATVTSPGQGNVNHQAAWWLTFPWPGDIKVTVRSQRTLSEFLLYTFGLRPFASLRFKVPLKFLTFPYTLASHWLYLLYMCLMTPKWVILRIGFHVGGCYSFYMKPNVPHPMLDIYGAFVF